MDSFVSYFYTHYDIDKLSDITWAEAVNSRARLSRMLDDRSRMIIDCDITKAPDGRAVCAHWPDLTSDLYFEDLIQAMQTTEQGLKLDFKDSDIVVECLSLLQQAQLSQPVILNADILNVAGAPAPDFDGREFLNACRTYYPDGFISVGWRTTDDVRYPYTERDVDAMLELVEGFNPITFPIRAVLLPRSWPHIKKLLSDKHRSLLIWNRDPISRELKHWIDKHIKPDRAFRVLRYL